MEIIIKSASNESQYKDELIEKELRNKFAIVNKINRPFYAQTYINITEFPGITSIELKTKLKKIDGLASSFEEFNPTLSLDKVISSDDITHLHYKSWVWECYIKFKGVGINYRGAEGPLSVLNCVDKCG